MNAPLTRRALLGATAAIGAVGLPISALALASPAADPDAGLLALIARHGEALAALEAADAIADPVRDRRTAEEPERPATLRASFGDIGLLPVSDTGREPLPNGRVRCFFSGIDVERLRAAGPATRPDWSEDGAPLPPAVHPLAEARRLEIIRAHDEWHAECRALTDRLGLRELNDACDRASDMVCDIEMAIMDAVPVTLAGFQAKARWIAATRQPEQWGVVLLWDLAGIERVAS